MLDFCGKKLALTERKVVEKAGRRLSVSELDCVDHAGGKIQVSVWDKAHDLVAQVPDGEGLTCIGVTAVREEGKVKLNLWPAGHVLRGGIGLSL